MAPATEGVRVFVANLDFRITWQELKEHFKKVGNVLRAEIMMDNSGKGGGRPRSKGYGTVELETQEEADRAISELNQSQMMGRNIAVREDREGKGRREEDPPRRREPEQSRPGDWNCPQCGTSQYARNAQCRKCNGPKPGYDRERSRSASRRRPRSPPTQGNDRGPHNSSANRDRPPGGRVFLRGDWVCPNCRSHQYGRDAECRKCHQPKPQGQDDERGGASYAPGRHDHSHRREADGRRRDDREELQRHPRLREQRGERRRPPPPGHRDESRSLVRPAKRRRRSEEGADCRGARGPSGSPIRRHRAREVNGSLRPMSPRREGGHGRREERRHRDDEGQRGARRPLHRDRRERADSRGRGPQSPRGKEENRLDPDVPSRREALENAEKAFEEAKKELEQARVEMSNLRQRLDAMEVREGAEVEKAKKAAEKKIQEGLEARLAQEKVITETQSTVKARRFELETEEEMDKRIAQIKEEYARKGQEGSKRILDEANKALAALEATLRQEAQTRLDAARQSITVPETLLQERQRVSEAQLHLETVEKRATDAGQRLATLRGGPPPKLPEAGHKVNPPPAPPKPAQVQGQQGAEEGQSASYSSEYEYSESPAKEEPPPQVEHWKR